MNVKLSNKYGWNEIEALKDKNIIKMAVGRSDSLFLDNKGIIWRCGFKKAVPFEIIDSMNYFIQNKIKITDIQCGDNHFFAIDNNGKVYVWGFNAEWACGIGTDIEDIEIPICIDTLKEI